MDWAVGASLSTSQSTECVLGGRMKVPLESIRVYVGGNEALRVDTDHSIPVPDKKVALTMIWVRRLSPAKSRLVSIVASGKMCYRSCSEKAGTARLGLKAVARSFCAQPRRIRYSS